MIFTHDERILILGAGIMQGPALRIAKEMGLKTAALDGDPRAPCIDLADRFECIDLKDKEGITAFGRLLQAEGGLSGIMTAGTDFSPSVAYAAEKLGLPGIPYEAALNASDKERMRHCFKQAGLPSPKFIVLRESPQPDLRLPFEYPVVVKPVDNMGGRGCRRVDSPSGLEGAVKDAVGFSRSGRVIVEEYMDGPEFSLDAVVYHGEVTLCGFADRHIYFPPFFIEMGHTIPSSLEDKVQARVLEVFIAGIRALGITLGAAKGDLKLSSRGPMIGEIAARLSGGYMSGWTYPYASGVEPTRGAILAALGKKPDPLVPHRNWTSAERAFISIPGRIRSIRGLEKAETTPGVKDLFLRVKIGDRVRFPENNVGKCGNVISAAPSRETAVTTAEGAARSIGIRLDAPDQDTDAFLAGGLFPGETSPMAHIPPAFPVSPLILKCLSLLPEPEFPSGGTGDFYILPFPEFTESGILDFMGRSVEASLAMVRDLTGHSLPLGMEKDEGRIPLGRSFWSAFVRGGYQGGAYWVDRLGYERIFPAGEFRGLRSPPPENREEP
ncbi:MAG: ATP-grasp domain-containing protein [Spirochaetaceae bacterium]|jgi:biotin carboxylase|nr:ATP-grasp domain-containing protein [Spirochaetaceae bacterium]